MKVVNLYNYPQENREKEGTKETKQNMPLELRHGGQPQAPGSQMMEGEALEKK